MLTTWSPEQRLLAGAALAAGIAAVAVRARALSPSGALAATIVGAAAVAAGWRWGALLVAYFVATSLLGRVGSEVKARRGAGLLAKGDRRDWRQVAANGGVFALAALWTAFGHGGRGDLPSDTLGATLGIGALAAAAADSWATEIGMLARGQPRSLVTWRPVPPGTSGGVSVVGTLATLGGAAFVAALAALLGWATPVALAAFAGGVAGAIADSLLGALVQERRWCPRCEAATEQAVHACGTATHLRGGLRLVDNDAVNLACSVAGGLLALGLVL